MTGTDVREVIVTGSGPAYRQAITAAGTGPNSGGAVSTEAVAMR